MPFDLTKLPPPEKEENIVHKYLFSPVVKLLGLQPALENATAPTEKDAAAQVKANIPQDEGLLHLAGRLATGRGTPAEYKGLLTGSTEAVTPALIAQAASLGHGTPAAIANGLIALKGANQVVDPSSTTTDRVMGAVDALTGGAGATSGVLRAMRARPAAATLSNIAGASKAASGSILEQQAEALLNDVKNHVPFSDQMLQEKYPELHAETVKNPGGKFAEQVFGSKGRPNPQSAAEISEQLAKERMANAAQEAKNLNKKEAYIQKENVQDSRNENVRRKFIQDSLKQDTTNSKLRDKYILQQGVQDTRNEKAVNTFQQKDAAARAADIKAETKFNVNQAKAAEAANTEQAKRVNEAIEEANAGHQQDVIDEFKNREDVVPSDPNLVETNVGQGEGGAKQTLRQNFRVKPPEEEPGVPLEGTSILPGSSGPKSPAGLPTTQGNTGSVSKASRPWSQLTKKEQLGLLPLLRDANVKGGITGDDLEGLGDTLAGRLQMIKEGREGADNANASLKAALKNVPLLSDDGSEEFQTFRSFLKKNGLTPSKYIAGKGKIGTRLDVAGEAAKNVLPGFKNESEYSLLDYLQGLKRGEQQSPVDELISKHPGEWWKNPPEEPPTAEVPVEPRPQAPEGPSGAETNISEAAEPEGPADTSFNPADLEATGQQNPVATPEPPVAPKARKTRGTKAVRAAETVVPELVNQDPLAPVGKPLTAEGIGASEPHPSMGTAPAESDLETQARVARTPEGQNNPDLDTTVGVGGGLVAKAARAEPELTPEQFAQQLNQTAEANPVAEVPFTLNGGQAPQAPPPVEGNLFGGEEPPPAAAAPLAPKPRPKGPAPAAAAAAAIGDLLSPAVQDATAADNAAKDLAAARAAGPRLVKAKAPVEVPPADTGANQVGDQAAAVGMNVAPEVSTAEPQGAAPVRFFKNPNEAAGTGYREAQAAFKAGEAPNEAARVAGRAASRINKEGVLDKAKQMMAAQIAAVREQIADPNTDSLTKTMLSKWLQDNEKGFGAVNPMVRLGLGLGGAAVGGATDPLGNRPASVLAGGALGAFAPDLASGLASSIPALVSRGSSAAPYTEKTLDVLNKLHNSGLLSPLSVAKKAAGDIGGLTLAGIENPTRAGDILRQFTTPEGRALIAQNFREGFHGPQQEAMTGLENFFQGEKNPLSWSGRTMGGLTKATKGVLGESGFSVPEQQYYTLTAEPEHGPTKYLYNALRRRKMVDPDTGQVKETGSRILTHLSPFARIGVNRLERGWEYSPFGLGQTAFDVLNGKIRDEGQAVKNIYKGLLGTAVGGAAYQLAPEDFVKDHPVMASTIASLGGPLGLPALAGMAMKGAKDSDNGVDWAKNVGQASQVIGRDIPGLRLLEDITGRQFPLGFGRNYFSGYTNFLRPLALMMDPEQPDVSSPDLPLYQRVFGQAMSNVPVVRSMLPRK